MIYPSKSLKVPLLNSFLNHFFPFFLSGRGQEGKSGVLVVFCFFWVLVPLVYSVLKNWVCFLMYAFLWVSSNLLKVFFLRKSMIALEMTRLGHFKDSKNLHKTMPKHNIVQLIYFFSREFNTSHYSKQPSKIITV